MSVRYEYMEARSMAVQYGPEFEIRGYSEEAMTAVETSGMVGPFGDDGLTRDLVLALAGDEVTVVAGTQAEILDMLDRARAAVLAIGAPPVVTVSFEVQAIAAHLETYEEEDQARVVWGILTDEQKLDAAQTCAVMFEHDGLWEQFAEAIREGLTTYEREQLGD
jgi:hypothetical protein